MNFSKYQVTCQDCYYYFSCKQCKQAFDPVCEKFETCEKNEEDEENE